MRMRAVWNGAVLAESDQTEVVEGNHYFPPDSLNREHFKENTHHTVCPWKGVASYYDVAVDGKVNRSAAWFYPEPSAAASNIRDYVAFWNGVKVERAGESSTDAEKSGRAGRLFGSLFN